MSHASELTGLALVLLAAVLCGALFSRLRQPAIVGYILAGILLGPTAFGVVESRDKVEFLAELGVLLLLFLIGLELPISQIRTVWRRAVAVTLGQIIAGVGASWFLATIFGWPLSMAILLGFVVALSSTAVVTKILLETNLISSPPGKMTLGILIAQDLAFVPMILLIPVLSGKGWADVSLWPILVAVLILGLLIFYLSYRERCGKPYKLPLSFWVADHPDLMPLRGLGWCLGGAALAGVFGLTPAYGAFLAGIGIGASSESQAMRQAVQPIQSVLLMVFFLSIGLLIDFSFILANLGAVLSLLFLVVIVKTGINIFLLRLFGEPWPHAVIIGILLAQIGEFSFVLGQSAVLVGTISEDVFSLIISVTALSLAITPLWMVTARRLLRIVTIRASSGREVIKAVFGRFAPRIMRILDNFPGRQITQTDSLHASHASNPQPDTPPSKTSSSLSGRRRKMTKSSRKTGL